MRKIAEHQENEVKNVVEHTTKEAEEKNQPQVQLLTMEQLTNFKLDDINGKLDYILQWIQTQLPQEIKEEPKKIIT